jgi:hypothetical protein
MAAGWFYSPSQIGRYIATRFTSLKPPRVGRLFSVISGLILTKIIQEQNPQSYFRSARADLPPMAHVPCWLLGMDLGCIRLLHRVHDGD